VTDRPGEPSLLQRLLWFDDPLARTGPETMGMDEVLQEVCARTSTPILRSYRWAGNWISFGYFQRWQDLPPGVNAVRRATGGGMVDHRTGQSYSLMLPREHPWVRKAAAEIYATIHGRLALALESCGCSVSLAESGIHPPGSGWCFVDSPVPGDLVQDGRKVGGAALRRNRWGVLHQGQLGFATLPWDHLVPRMAEEVIPFQPGTEEESAATELGREKYGSPGWMQMR